MMTQDGLPFQSHLNQGLFADHFLGERISDLDFWSSQDNSLLDSVLSEITAIYRREAEKFTVKTTEATTEKSFIRPVLDQLWADSLGQQSYAVQALVLKLGQPQEADYAFFGNSDSAQQAQALRGSQEYWKNALAAGEAKSWNSNLDKLSGKRSPSSQITEYLYRSQARWGVLTNGKIWRLYEREKSHGGGIYFEVNLEDILIRQDLVAFKWFYCFFGRAAFLPDREGKCFLDRVLAGSQKYATEVSDNLKKSVYEALRVLIEGFLEHNKLDKSDEEVVRKAHKNALITLYRVLFLLYAEDRKLLPVDEPSYQSYSFRALQEEIHAVLKNGKRVYTLHRQSIWAKLIQMFEAIDVGDPECGVPAYNGGLFSPARFPDIKYITSNGISKYGIGDKHISEIIDRLVYDRPESALDVPGDKRVDYATLDVRHLGGIYEGLLELKPRIADRELREVLRDKKYIYEPHTVLLENGEEPKGRFRRVISPGQVYLETDKGERKSTGSYYTPDYIVSYIVERTLSPLVDRALSETAVLGKKLEKGVFSLQEELKDKSLHPNERKKKRNAIQEEYLKLMQPYLSLKILDPAMGSGHFLVGAVDFISHAMASDDTLSALVEPDRGETAQGYYKRLVAEHCLYGVDINDLAVELAKLSLWLHTASTGKVLSFLDHHLRVGNSLLGARIEEDLSKVPQPFDPKERKRLAASGKTGQLAIGFERTLTGKSLSYLLDEFEKIYSGPSDTREDEVAKEKIYEGLDKARDDYRNVANVWLAPFYGVEITAENYQNVVDALGGSEAARDDLRLRPWFTESQDVAAGRRFFHWEIEFPDVFFEPTETGAKWKPKEKRGFDAVIGNPPYIRQEGLGEDKPAFENLWSEVFHGTADIYVYFYGLGMRLLNERGTFGMITSNKFMRSNYGKELREYLAANANIREIVDFGELPVFSEAATFPSIVILRKGEQSETRFTQIGDLELAETKLPELVEETSIALGKSAFEGENWSLGTEEEVAIMRKMDAMGVSLCDYLAKQGAQLRRGVVTGFNQGFIINRATRDRLIAEDNNSEKLIKPIIVGDDVRHYHVNYQEQYLIFTRRGTDISDYPALEKHLDQWKSDLTPKNDALDDGPGRKPGDYPWYEIQDSTEYFTDFDKAKIVYPEIAKEPRFHLDKEFYFPIKTVFFLSVEDWYLLSTLNSKVCFWYLQQVCSVLGDADNHGRLTMQAIYIERLPIRCIESTTPKKTLEKLLKAATGLYESSIDSNNADVLLEFVSERLSAKPEQAGVVRDLLAHLAKEMTELNKTRQKEDRAFLKWLEDHFFGRQKHFGAMLRQLSGKTKLYEFSKHSYDEVKAVLSANSKLRKKDPESKKESELLAKEFDEAVERLEPINRRIELTDKLIDRIVYKLYGLTDAEIAIVAGQGK